MQLSKNGPPPFPCSHFLALFYVQHWLVSLSTVCIALMAMWISHCANVCVQRPASRASIRATVAYTCGIGIILWASTLRVRRDGLKHGEWNPSGFIFARRGETVSSSTCHIFPLLAFSLYSTFLFFAFFSGTNLKNFFFLPARRGSNTKVSFFSSFFVLCRESYLGRK